MAKKDKQQNDPILPTLPNGYFWRVGPKEGLDWGWGGDSYRGYGVSLHQGRKRLYSSTVISHVSDALIVKAAEVLWGQWDSKRREDAERTRLTGDYPPKTL